MMKKYQMVHHDKRLSKLIKIKMYSYKLYVFLHLHVFIFIKNNNLLCYN